MDVGPLMATQFSNIFYDFSDALISIGFVVSILFWYAAVM